MLWISALLARHPLTALQGFEAWFCIYSHFHAARLVCVGWNTFLMFGQPCPFRSPFALGLAHLDSIPFGRHLPCLPFCPRGMGLFIAPPCQVTGLLPHSSRAWCSGVPPTHAHWLGPPVLVPPLTRHAHPMALYIVEEPCTCFWVACPATGGGRHHSCGQLWSDFGILANLMT